MSVVGGVGLEFDETKKYAGYVVIVFGLLTALLSGLIQKRNKSFTELQNDLESEGKEKQRLEARLEQRDATLRRVLDSTLIVISAKLFFDNAERVTLFLIERGNKEERFNIIGRYSPYSECCKINRKKGTIYKPFLSKACRNTDGELFIDDLDFNDPDQYKSDLLKKHGIDFTEKLIKMRMSPQNLFFKVIVEDGHQCGVIMIESRERNRLKVQEVKHALAEEQQLILEFIRHHRTK